MFILCQIEYLGNQNNIQSIISENIIKSKESKAPLIMVIQSAPNSTIQISVQKVKAFFDIAERHAFGSRFLCCCWKTMLHRWVTNAISLYKLLLLLFICLLFSPTITYTQSRGQTSKLIKSCIATTSKLIIHSLNFCQQLNVFLYMYMYMYVC